MKKLINTQINTIYVTAITTLVNYEDKATGYYNLTMLCDDLGINKHNFLRSGLLGRTTRNAQYKGNPILITNVGNGGKALIHPVIIPSVFKSVSIERHLEFEAHILYYISRGVL